jgi:hypothetical protein
MFGADRGTCVSNVDAAGRWAELPGPKWARAAEAKTWLIGQRRELGWSHKDVATAFFACAAASDLYIGSGGGPRCDRATEKRVARFEREGQVIPDWMYWMPLVVRHAQVPTYDLAAWERENIPHNRALRQDLEEADAYAHQYDLDGEEIELIMRFRDLAPRDRALLRDLANTVVLQAIRHGLDQQDIEQPVAAAEASSPFPRLGG